MADERIKEEFRKANLTIPTGMAVNMVMMDSVYENFSTTIRTGERIGKIEVLEELIEWMDKNAVSALDVYDKLVELKESQS